MPLPAARVIQPEKRECWRSPPNMTDPLKGLWNWLAAMERNLTLCARNNITTATLARLRQRPREGPFSAFPVMVPAHRVRSRGLFPK